MNNEQFSHENEEGEEDYQQCTPKAEEIEAYAKFLGIDPVEESDLMYIAKEGLTAPCPEPWISVPDQDGNIIYIN